MAQKVFLLCDHDKIGRISFSRFATIEEIDTLTTDTPDETLRQKLEEAGVGVIGPDMKG